MAMFWCILLLGALVPQYANSDCSVEEFGAFKRDVFVKLTSLAQSVLDFTKSDESEKKEIQSALNKLLLKEKDMPYVAKAMHDIPNVDVTDPFVLGLVPNVALPEVERMVPNVASPKVESMFPTAASLEVEKMVADVGYLPEVEQVTDDVQKNVDVVNKNVDVVKNIIDVVKNNVAVKNNADDVNKNADDVEPHVHDDVATKKASAKADKIMTPLEKKATGSAVECKSIGMMCSPQNMMFCCEKLSCRREPMMPFGKCRF